MHDTSWVAAPLHDPRRQGGRRVPRNRGGLPTLKPLAPHTFHKTNKKTKQNKGFDTRALAHARKMEVALQLTDNASLRGMEGGEGMWYFSVYDFVNFVTGHEPGNGYAQKTFSRLVKPGSEHAEAVSTNCRDCQFPVKPRSEHAEEVQSLWLDF